MLGAPAGFAPKAPGLGILCSIQEARHHPPLSKFQSRHHGLKIFISLNKLSSRLHTLSSCRSQTQSQIQTASLWDRRLRVPDLHLRIVATVALVCEVKAENRGGRGDGSVAVHSLDAYTETKSNPSLSKPGTQPSPRGRRPSGGGCSASPRHAVCARRSRHCGNKRRRRCQARDADRRRAQVRETGSWAEGGAPSTMAKLQRISEV